MLINSPSPVLNASAWSQVYNGKITCPQALELLVDSQGNLNLGFLDPEINARFFRSFPQQSTSYPVIPLLLWKNCYYLGSPVNLTLEAIQQISDRVQAEIKIISITNESYQRWSQIQKIPAADTEGINNLTKTLLAEVKNSSRQILRILKLITLALKYRASDIHLEPNPEGLKIRFRIDGILRYIETFPPEISPKIVVALKVMSNMDIAESRIPQDGRIGREYQFQSEQGGKFFTNLDMRVSTLPCFNGEKVVIRLLPQKNPFSSLEDIGFTANSLNTYKSWLQKPQGLIVLTGPTGSGKTSTLYTSLQVLANSETNIVTVEDPVEYVLSGINQTQINKRSGMTFAIGLRALLRQDPDVLMVGEVRDAETAETVIQAALTGHLIFTTMHTVDTVTAITRLKNMGIDPSLISEVVLGIVAQRLVRRVCPYCAIPHPPTPKELKILGLSLEQANPDAWRRGKGCSKCFNSGYLGREAMIELLNFDRPLRRKVPNSSTEDLYDYLHQTDFASFRLAAIEKITSGLTTTTEILRVLPDTALLAPDPKSG